MYKVSLFKSMGHICKGSLTYTNPMPNIFGFFTPGQGAPPKSNLPPALISSEFSGVLTEKLRVVAKVYKMAAEDEIKEDVFALRPLRGKVEKFFQFEEEVRETITSVFDKQRSEQDVFQKVCRSRIEVGPVIDAEITMVLKAVYRRLTARMKATEPWTVTFSRDMLSVMEVVKQAPSAFGVIHTTTNMECQLSYSKETRLLRDFSKLCNTSRESVMSYLCKRTKALRKENTKFIVKLDKPFVLTYMKRKQHLIVKYHYIFTNEHGYSFQA